MIRKYLFLFFTILSLTGIGQNVEIVVKRDNPHKEVNPSTFDFIDQTYDLKSKDYIATLRGFVVNSGKSILPDLFNNFKYEANLLGANSFFMEKVVRQSDTILVEISVYYLDETEIKKNLEAYPDNMVYVIGDVDKRQTSKTIKFNNKKMILAPMEFISYQNKVGLDAVISIGGLFGAKVWIKGKEGRLPEHLSVAGFGIGPGNIYNPSLSFHTGRIYPVDLNFGQFLIHILKEKKIDNI